MRRSARFPLDRTRESPLPLHHLARTVHTFPPAAPPDPPDETHEAKDGRVPSQNARDSRDGAGLTARIDTLYALIRERVHRELRRERLGGEMNTTSLAHDVYLELRSDTSIDWCNPNRVRSWIATLVRNALVDRARKRDARKRGGDRVQVPLEGDAASCANFELEILELEELLKKLETDHPRPACVFEKRVFGGMANDEIAAALGVSPRSVGYDWSFARAWMLDHLERQ